jgi:ACS family hexuronate transporter-like MFS transporter
MPAVFVPPKMKTGSIEANPPVRTRAGVYRWTICALLFLATTINYIDRQTISVLAPDLQHALHWNELDYGNIIAAFQIMYAVGQVLTGFLVDRIGTFAGFAVFVTIWSIAAVGHAGARSAFQFGLMRALLGLGESGNFPTCIKTVAEWFPRQLRALATGLFNSGSNIGAILTPLIVPVIFLKFGWPAAFIATGVLGFAWLIAWLVIYPLCARRGLVKVHEKPVRAPWLPLLGKSQTWAIIIGKFLTDPVWWFYLFWLPKFLNSTYGLTIDKLGPPLVVIYLASDAGSILGGAFSSYLLKQGWSLNAARKTAMLTCALCVVPTIFASQASNQWVAVALISLATAAHQGWSANLFTLSSDLFPRPAVGSVIGMAGGAGACGGIFIAGFAGFILQTTKSYVPLFLIAGTAYLIAFAVIQLLSPSLRPARVEGVEDSER